MIETSDNMNNLIPFEKENGSNKIHKKLSHHLGNTLSDHIQDLVARIHSRNKQIDIMRAFGIIFIIWGHSYQPPFVFFPVFYALALFFFTSGYFFTPQVTIRDKFRYFLKKTRKQLILYLLFNLFFGLLTTWLKPKGINLGLDLNLETFFIYPFGRGDQFVLYLSAWFLLNLYFISIFAGIVFQKSNKVNIFISVCAFILMCISLLFTYNKPDISMWVTFFSRCAFGFAFFCIGYLVHTYEPKIQKFVVMPINVIILYLIFDVSKKNFGDVNYDILFGNVNNQIVIVPILATLCIIFILYIGAFYLKNILSQHSFIYLIGQHTFSIMVWHLTCFFLVNFILYKLTFVTFMDLSNVYFTYNIENLWIVYQLPAIVLPILLIETYYLIKQKCLSFLNHSLQIRLYQQQNRPL